MKSNYFYLIIFSLTFINQILCTQKTCGKIVEVSNENPLNEEELKNSEEEGLNSYIIKTDKSLNELKDLLKEEHLLYLNDKKLQKSMKKIVKKTTKGMSKQIKKDIKNNQKEMKKSSKKNLKENKKSKAVVEEFSEVSENIGEITNLIYIDTTTKKTQIYKLKDELTNEDTFSYAYSIIAFLIVVCLVLLGLQILFSKDKNSSDYTILETDSPQEFTLKGF